MNSVKELIGNVVPDFKGEGPNLEEIRKMAEELGLDLTDEEYIQNSVDIRLMTAEKSACSYCKGLETCPLEISGYVNVFIGRGYRERPSFGVKECHRLKQFREIRRNEELLDGCKIPSVLRQKTFTNYNFEENAKAAGIALDFTTGGRTKGAVFYGPTGVGKTHLASAVLNNRIINGLSGIYATLPDLMDSLRSAMRTERLDEARAALIETEVLFLDDIGAENPTEFVTEELFKIINGRWLNGRVIIGTSNLTPEGIRKRYAGLGGERIFSRLSELCEWVEMKGRDHRIS